MPLNDVRERWQRAKAWLLKREPPPNLLHVTAFFAGAAGLSMFMFTIERHRQDRAKELQALRAVRLEDNVDRLFSYVASVKPRNALTDIRLYKKVLAKELRGGKFGRDVPREEVDKLWLQRREEGEFVDAKRIEFARMEISIMWALLYRMWKQHPAEEDRALIRGLLESDMVIGRPVALKTLLLVETLDKAICQARKQDWETYKPKIYDFIRKVYSIPADWPDENAMDEDDALISHHQGHLVAD